MATVFLARLSGVAGFQRLVAIKRLHPHLAREPEFVEMFLDEARLAARIHHPNVVPIQEVGESEDGFYLVMDYIEGDTLARVLARAAKAQTKVPYGVTIRILLDVLAGLHAAHEMKDDHQQPLHIVHRDISPQNILVGVDGVARVVDFGVARAASRLSTTRSGQLKGKLAYMAPEQARGGDIDRRADLFSCGIVLWEALATKRLFKGEGEAETLNKVLYDPIKPPSSERPDVPKALEDVCMKALARDVDQRYESAQEFGDELEKAARALSCVGSVREVAQCLQEVIGVDLTQQRDAVRAWLARSEPSHASGPRSKPPPPHDSIVTRVDGNSKSEPSSARNSSAGGARSRRPSMPPSGRPSQPPVDRQAVTSPSPEGLKSTPPEKSVSSAVIQVAGPGVVAPAKPRTAGRIAIAVVAAVVLVGVGALGAKSLGGRESAKPVAGNAAPSASASASENVVASPSASANSGTGTGESAPVPSAAPSASAKVGTGKPGTKPIVRPGTAPVVRPNTGGTAPDDLNKNPYR